MNVGQVLTGVFGLGVPVIVGSLLGQHQAGIIAAFGGLALSTAGAGANLKAGATDLAAAMTAGALGFLTAAVLPQDHLFLLCLPPLFFAAAMIGGISRRLARSTTVFNLFTVIGLNLAGPEFHSLMLPALFLVGAAATFVFALVLWPLRRMIDDGPRRTTDELWNRWKESLRGWVGWGYAFRVAAASLSAVAAVIVLPMGHPLWILLTVVTVVHRNIHHVPPRMFQRGVGTAAGVVFLVALSLLAPTREAAIVLIAVLTGLRVHLKDLNYLAFSAVMTVLVILMLDFGSVLSYQTMLDRLVGTVLGCVLAYTFGYQFWPKPQNRD
jgi:uncharacterized membrane protein YccC